MFELAEFRHLVNEAGKALESEDKTMAKIFAQRQSLYQRTHPPGILWLNNERYYQHIIARHLILHGPYRVALEDGPELFDNALYAGGDETQRIAVGEIKRWMSPSGETEITGIENDLRKVRDRDCPGFVLVISANPPDQKAGNVQWLADHLSIKAANLIQSSSFPSWGKPCGTTGWPTCEVWVLGILCPKTG